MLYNLEIDSYIHNLKITRKYIFLHSFHPWCAFVIPLKRHQMVTIHFGKGVDDMGTQGWVYIFRVKLSGSISVLRPVCIVTNPSISQGYTYEIFYVSF